MKRSKAVTTMPYMETLCRVSISAHKTTPVLTFLSHPDQRERRTISCKMECSAIIEKISRETLNKFTFGAVALLWIAFGSTLIGAFSDMEYNEPRQDFRCDVTGDKANADFIRVMCYDQYRIQNQKLGIPPYLFVLVNMSLIPIVTLIYSIYANSIVERLKRSHQDAQGEPTDRGRNLFFAYLCQLIFNIIFEITFIILLETQQLYPRNFPSHFSCSSSVNGTQSTTSFNCSNHRAASKSFWIRVVTAANGIFALFAFLEIIWILSRGRNGKEFMENWRFYADHLKSNSDEQQQGQAERNLLLLESQHSSLNIPHEPRNDEITNSSEHQEHAQTQNDLHSGQTDGIPLLESHDRAVNITHEPRNDEITNSAEHQEHAQAQNDLHSGQTDGIPLMESQDRAVNIPPEQNNDKITNSSELQEHAQVQNDFHSAIETLKKNCLQDTDKLNDLKQPFGRPNPGEGHIHDLTIDKIYVHVSIVEGRAYHEFTEDRREQLKKYPPHADDCLFKKPGDLLDRDHKNVLVVGRPGIGKTSFSTKFLRLWASGEAFNGDEHFNVVFLVKFRRFNNYNVNLSLRDLMARSETVQSLDDAVWDFIKQEPTKVLLIFDGLDEYSRKEDIKAQDEDPTYKNCVEEKMPVYVLYNKLAEGKLLPGASILTTTRPTAVKCVRHLPFQRTVEIRGFTSDDVKKYVENFTQDYPEAMEKMWEHIKSNINLFSFCYIPMNCFLICHCLLQIILSESSQALPTKMTDIYKMTVKMFLLNHNREGFSPEELARLKSTYMDEPFDKLPEELQQIFNSLGEMAFKAIEEGRLLFESNEVSGLEDCGLLHKLPDQKRRALDDPPKSQFCFTHLTVQEFFAAKHLVDSKTDEEIERFVCEHIYGGTWQVVLQFAAGLLKSSLSTDIFIKLLPESTEKGKNRESSEPKTLTYWPATREDKDLVVQVCKCLYEINDEKQQPVLQNKIEKIKFNAVDFRECSLAPIDVAAVLHFLENAEEVLFISLSINHLGDLGANEVKKIVVNKERKLESLNLSYNQFTDNAAKDFAAALQHSNCKLESLYLMDHNEFTDNAAKDFAAALKHSNCKLESLSLSDNKFTDNAAKDFAAALKHSNCKLESLSLSDNKFTDNAAKDFAAALKHSNSLKHSNCKLESLDLSDNRFTDNAAKDFAAALKHSNCKLESLDLSDNRFTDNAAKDFAAALKHSNCKLESLDLSDSRFTDNAAKDFAAALEHSNFKLESLDLSRNYFTDNAAKDFAAAVKHSNCKLESLDLSYNKFTDNAAKDFAAALKHSNCKLESLYLNSNNFTDNAANDFAAALKHSNCKLVSLTLSSNKFTDNSAKDFAAALKHTLQHSNCKLKSLDLSYNNFTQEGCNYLTDAGKLLYEKNKTLTC
ncbi:NACHT, LRR and PYD domains-containing protein 12-like [Acropora millepora]|uniref:NACHT, LRR and PYD domains-containing protein 12-like n=1 Tax=Acropora millepora TaxID=45264 RepID=UPI001CF2F4EC|nr:NACHT, LRR and PYD domains-containing protein 12-like [Acropora millepora]